MTAADFHQQWSDFLNAWPPSRVRQMTLEEYTNPDKDDAFIYWIESRLDKMGSIWGGSAFKFGIYCRDKTLAKKSSGGRVWGEKYAWLSKFGATEDEAFATIRSRLVEVVDAVQAGNLALIDEIDLAPVLKWKTAFLYQNREKPVLFSIFKKEMLFFHYRSIDPQAKLGSTPYHVMYETLLDRHRDRGDIFEITQPLWETYNEEERSRTPRAWAVPLSWTIQEQEEIESLCSKTQVEPEDVDPLLDKLLIAADISEGDLIALMVDGEVRALGTLTNVEPGQLSWDQVPLKFQSGLLVNPTSEVRSLNASERKKIWKHLPPQKRGRKQGFASPRYWKIAPGKNAVVWPEWLERGIASIGWSRLGDIGNIDKAEFDKRVKKQNYREGVLQVWSFSQIRPGDRIVANQGKHRVLGIGTVESGYFFEPGTHLIENHDFPHKVKVRWDDTVPRPVKQNGWSRTLIELTKDEFESLISQEPSDEAGTDKPEIPPPPPEPRNIILYGPPGTGKTYSTVRRALELILGSEKLAGLNEKALMALFREHQARGQIEFVTFHQAYGYEEFVEGIRPVLDQSAEAQVRYRIHDGIFKRIALRAAVEGLRIESDAPDFDELWDLLTKDLAKEDSRTATSQTGKNYQLSLSSQGNIQVKNCELDEDGNITWISDKHQLASKESVRIYWNHRDELGPEPEKLSYEKTMKLFARERGSKGGNQYTALWIVYSQLFVLNRTAGSRKAELIDKVARVQQSLDKPGPTTTFSFSARSPQYVLIIDEINRGNMSKILGELITLLEPDKRLAARSELKLPLSYSPQHRFAVPPNLHVLGTMNTADRSIALMDVALRRRFTFEELMPDAGVIRSVLSNSVQDQNFIELVADLFDTLNDRIRFLYDRDHQLGHSYFLDIRDLNSLRQVFLDRVIPMLQEYFYGAWDKICIVLGCPYNESGEPKRNKGHLNSYLFSVDGKTYSNPIVTARTFQELSTLGFDHDDYDDRIDYQIREAFRQGSLSSEDLYRTFLGVLPSDEESFSRRLASLQGEEQFTTEPLEAIS